MYTLAADVPVEGQRQARRPRVRHGDLGALAAASTRWIRSINRDRRLYLKWGLEPSYKLLPKLFAVSMRFDRVILDVYDSREQLPRAVPEA